MLLVEMMMQRVIVSKHQKTSMYLGQWNRNNVPVGNYFGLDCIYLSSNSLILKIMPKDFIDVDLSHPEFTGYLTKRSKNARR